MGAQQPLEFDPAPVRVPVSDDPRLVREARPRLHRQALLILGRLQEGPATADELIQISRAQRLGARIYELRKAGHNIPRPEQDHVTGWSLYRLVIP